MLKQTWQMIGVGFVNWPDSELIVITVRPKAELLLIVRRERGIKETGRSCAMQIGQIIRKYRRMKNMTQEEMANRLGVTAPAVNKWEKGNSLPDITLLAPIARLLGISLETLLSFREELTREEIQDIVYTVDSMLREKTYQEAFAWAKDKLEQYPNCEDLMLEAAVLLQAGRMKQDRDGGKERGEDFEDGNSSEYDRLIAQWFLRALESGQEQIRTLAANSLFSFYLNQGRYDKAEGCLAYLSDQNPERKRKQALIYHKTGRREEAYKAYEELLFSIYQTANPVFNSLYLLAQEDGNVDKARMMVEKQSALAGIFEMGEYYETIGKLELSADRKDAEVCVALMKTLLSSLDDMDHFTRSPLYEHMAFQTIRKEFVGQLRDDLLKAFKDEETYGFLKGNKEWEKLISGYCSS